MQTWFEATETATAKFEISGHVIQASGCRLRLRETDDLFTSSGVTIEASRDQFAAWAKMILREVEPAALAAETEEA
jgi:hypothetical protein